MHLNILSLLVVKKNEKKQNSCQEKRDMFGKKLDRPLKYFLKSKDIKRIRFKEIRSIEINSVQSFLVNRQG